MVLSVPPIIIGAPGALFTIITPIAPAFCASFTFITKAQVPLLISAIFPVKELEGAPVQARWVPPVASLK